VRLNIPRKTAIHAAIGAWQNVLVGVSDASHDPNRWLCDAFLYADSDKPSEQRQLPCQKCPVFRRTKQRGCRGTPAEAFPTVFEAEHYELTDELPTVEPAQVIGPRTQAVVLRQMQFLDSLLPEDA
jgi:hypothetical protein